MLSQILIEVTSDRSRQAKSRLSYLAATAGCWRSRQKALCDVALLAGGGVEPGRPGAVPSAEAVAGLVRGDGSPRHGFIR